MKRWSELGRHSQQESARCGRRPPWIAFFAFAFAFAFKKHVYDVLYLRSIST